jgi:PAS domain S-box-containing protein
MHEYHETSHPYEAMVNNMPEGFIYFKAVSGLSGGQLDYRLIDINKSFESTLGLFKGQIIDKNFSEISKINQNASIYLNSLIEKVRFADDSTQFELYNPYTGQWHSFSIFCEAEDYFTALFRDTTETKSMKEKLSHNEKYKYYFDLSTDMLFIRDFKKNLIEFNPAWFTTLGYTRDELLSANSWDLIHPEDLIRTKSEYENMMNGKKINGFENRFLCKNGEYKWLS